MASKKEIAIISGFIKLPAIYLNFTSKVQI